MMKPVDMAVNPPYGKRGPMWKTCGVHTGDDFPCAAGTRLVAAIAGTIRHRNYGAAFGQHQFAISPSPGQPFADHEVFYAHTRTRLPDGTEVQMGDFVAESGAEGNVSGPHLHFEYHTAKNRWDCGVCVDPQPIYDHGPQAGGSPSGGGITPKYTSRIMSDMLGFDEPPDGYPDGNSDTIKELQWRLNNTKLQGGQTLPETGSYWVETDEEVRLWQQQVCGDTPDPERKSYLGPAQRARMFPPPYEIVDRGLPRVAGGSGGDVGGGGGGGVAPPPVPDVAAWFVPDSLKALRDEVNARWPDRATASDGTIGDTAHSTSMSEHNPVGHQFGPQFGTPGAVHAMDITAEGIDVQVLLDALIGDQRVWYVIHAGFIYSKTYGWAKNPYTGSNPHNTHIHISLRADDQADAVRAEQDTSTWLEPAEEKPVPPPEPGGEDYVTRAEYDADMRRIAEAFWKAGN